MSFLAKLLFIVKVEGMSGWPHLVSGKHYLATNFVEPHLGDFIVFTHPQFPDSHLVKRVKDRQGDYFLVESNVPWATSGEELGPIHISAVQGKLIAPRSKVYLKGPIA